MPTQPVTAFNGLREISPPIFKSPNGNRYPAKQVFIKLTRAVIAGIAELFTPWRLMFPHVQATINHNSDIPGGRFESKLVNLPIWQKALIGTAAVLTFPITLVIGGLFFLLTHLFDKNVLDRDIQAMRPFDDNPSEDPDDMPEPSQTAPERRMRPAITGTHIVAPNVGGLSDELSPVPHIEDDSAPGIPVLNPDESVDAAEPGDAGIPGYVTPVQEPQAEVAPPPIRRRPLHRRDSSVSVRTPIFPPMSNPEPVPATHHDAEVLGEADPELAEALRLSLLEGAHLLPTATDGDDADNVLDQIDVRTAVELHALHQLTQNARNQSLRTLPEFHAGREYTLSEDRSELTHAGIIFNRSRENVQVERSLPFIGAADVYTLPASAARAAAIHLYIPHNPQETGFMLLQEDELDPTVIALACPEQSTTNQLDTLASAETGLEDHAFTGSITLAALRAHLAPADEAPLAEVDGTPEESVLSAEVIADEGETPAADDLIDTLLNAVQSAARGENARQQADLLSESLEEDSADERATTLVNDEGHAPADIRAARLAALQHRLAPQPPERGSEDEAELDSVVVHSADNPPVEDVEHHDATSEEAADEPASPAVINPNVATVQATTALQTALPTYVNLTAYVRTLIATAANEDAAQEAIAHYRNTAWSVAEDIIFNDFIPLVSRAESFVEIPELWLSYSENLQSTERSYRLELPGLTDGISRALNINIEDNTNSLPLDAPSNSSAVCLVFDLQNIQSTLFIHLDTGLISIRRNDEAELRVLGRKGNVRQGDLLRQADLQQLALPEQHGGIFETLQPAVQDILLAAQEPVVDELSAAIAASLAELNAHEEETCEAQRLSGDSDDLSELDVEEDLPELSEEAESPEEAEEAEVVEPVENTVQQSQEWRRLQRLQAMFNRGQVTHADLKRALVLLETRFPESDEVAQARQRIDALASDVQTDAAEETADEMPGFTGFMPQLQGRRSGSASPVPNTSDAEPEDEPEEESTSSLKFNLFD